MLTETTNLKANVHDQRGLTRTLFRAAAIPLLTNASNPQYLALLQAEFRETLWLCFFCGDRPWPNSIFVGKIIVLSIYRITGVNLVNFARLLVYWIFKNVDGLNMVQSIKNFTIRAFRRINPRVNPANTDGEIHGQSYGQTSIFILIW